MENEQVSNASITEAPESLVSDDAMGDFFGDLDRSLNGGILDSEEMEVQETSENVGGNTQAATEVQQEDVETLKKRYSDSSKEGKRLNNRLKELEPYLPILDEMRKDPNLISHVRGYFEGGGQTPKTMTERLNLGEDFIFDPDDAVTNPASDSAKVLNATIDGVVQTKLKNEFSKQNQQSRVDGEIREFRSQNEMSDDEWLEFQQYAENKVLSLEDIFYLKNKGQANESAPVRNPIKEIRNVQSKPKSLATTGSTVVDKSDEDQVFDSILGIDKQMIDAFG
tara:strand:+ start:4090 stop:4932 length:843 start_codon:yes stop_codon:yes gene_type:complete